MNINSMISTVPNLQYTVGSSNSNNYDNNLTQLEEIGSILSEFDPSNLSAEDATSIANSFSQSGIEPSKELADAMQSFGFDAQEVGTLAGVAAPRPNMPPPPPPSMQEKDEVTDILSELLSSDEDDESETTTNAFEELLDYTSHIVSLNDDSKGKVMDMLEKYNSDNTQLSKEDASSVVKNSLSQIFGDSNNYKSVSFYA